jgi:hypothetical protein
MKVMGSQVGAKRCVFVFGDADLSHVEVKRPKLRPGAASADTKSLLRPVSAAKTVVKRKWNAGEFHTPSFHCMVTH